MVQVKDAEPGMRSGRGSDMNDVPLERVPADIIGTLALRAVFPYRVEVLCNFTEMFFRLHNR